MFLLLVEFLFIWLLALFLVVVDVRPILRASDSLAYLAQHLDEELVGTRGLQAFPLLLLQPYVLATLALVMFLIRLSDLQSTESERSKLMEVDESEEENASTPDSVPHDHRHLVLDHEVR